MSDETDAQRAIWTEGYERGKAEARAEMERLRRIMHETELARDERWERAKQAETKLKAVVEAARGVIVSANGPAIGGRMSVEPLTLLALEAALAAAQGDVRRKGTTPLRVEDGTLDAAIRGLPRPVAAAKEKS